MSSMKVGVIGAGASGLCAIKYSLSFDCEVIAFERSDTLGGTWVYTDDVGKDKYGNDIHSSMYKNLRTNLPKEIMGYHDFPFPPSMKSYLPASDVNDYLNHYVDTFHLRGYIKFRHHVLRVRPLPDNGTWEVIVLDHQMEKYETFLFDIVLVCNGHLNTPTIPHFEGRHVFRGHQMHSHDYRTPNRFSNKTVLTIGGGPSGVDITQDVAKQARKVFWSNHLSPRKDIMLDNLVQKSDVKRFTESGAEFSDGSHEYFDEILYCTGYRTTFPFLSVDCGLLCENNYVRPLFKHCLNINQPSMAIIGLTSKAPTIPVFDLQVRFCLTFMTGRKVLPSKDEMLTDTKREMEENRDKGMKESTAHFLGSFQGRYYNDLASLAGIEPIKPVMLKIYQESHRTKEDDFMSYQDYNFTVVDDENFEVKLSRLQ